MKRTVPESAEPPRKNNQKIKTNFDILSKFSDVYIRICIMCLVPYHPQVLNYMLDLFNFVNFEVLASVV